MASQIAREVMRLASNKQYKKALSIISKIRIKNLTVTRATLKSKYGLKPKEIEKLNYIEVDNPIVKSAGKMRLYLRAEAHCLSLKIKRSKTIKNKIL